MARQKALIVYPHLVRGVDWHVAYSIRNQDTGKMFRRKIYKGLDQCETKKEKEALGAKLVKEYTEKIKMGWRPWISDDTAVYEDQVMYANEAAISTRKKASIITVRTYVSHFLRWKKAELQKKSYETYQSKLRLFVLYLEKKKLADYSVTTYNPDIISDFLQHLVKKKKLSRVTIGKYVQILHSFFEFLKKHKKLPMDNPVSGIQRIGIIKDEAPAAMPPEIRKVLGEKISKEDPQLWLACMVIYYTALRPGRELRLLKIENINFFSKTITVRNYYAKTLRTETIDIPDQLYNQFLELGLDKLPKHYYVFGREGRPGEFFLNKHHMRLRHNKFRDDLSLPDDVKFYSWKHSGATELWDAGTNIYEVQRHLRHKSVTSTEEYVKKRLGQRSNKIKHSFPEIK
jgi:integrase